MSVPYTFANQVPPTILQLSELDANFSYLTSSPVILSLGVSGNLSVGGNASFAGVVQVNDIVINGALTIDGVTVNPTGVTGSGLLVLNTGPTLVAPILGTPVSGNLTNCTGYPINQIVGMAANVLPFLTNPSSGNLATAVVDETGSGNVVFNNNPTINSPILTSPVLGTPASGDLSLCSNYPAPNLVGITPISKGGTGLGVTGSVGEIISVVSPGTLGYISSPPVSSLFGGAASQVLYQTAANSTGFVPNGSPGQVFISNGSLAPFWGQVNLTVGVTGALPIANGGTNATTAQNALNNLLPNQTGNAGRVLTTDGLGNVSWIESLSSIDTVALLRSFPVIPGDTIYLAGYNSVGDGGGGLFYGVSGGSYTDNAGTIITTGFGVTSSSAWVRIYEGPVSVKFFGAYGNGVNDDTFAIQASMGASSSIYIPKGTYLCSSSITVPQSGSIFGDGSSLSILQPISSGIEILTLTNSSSPLMAGPSIEGIGFYIPPASSVTGVYAIKMRGASTSQRINNCTFDDISVYASSPNKFSFAINMENCANTHITNCRFVYSNFGIYITNCADTNILNVDIQLGNNVGFYIAGGAPGAFDEGCRIIGCSTNGQQYGAYIINQAWGEISGCSFTTCPGGALIVDGSQNWQIGSCEFSSAPVGGGSPSSSNIEIINNSSNITIIGSFAAIGTFGIYADNSTNIIFSQNKLTNNSNVDIYASNCDRMNASGNICESASVPQSIVEAGTSNYNIFSSNIINGASVQLGANSVFVNNLNY